ncbi:hypothetical protein JCM3765_004514 [Sporobolomyces pararoseus]
MSPSTKKTDNAIAASSSDAPPQPAPKRPRKTQSRVKGKQGAFKKAMDLPVDLIWEVCTHLDVQDLLALSTTNKNFRAVVTGEGSSTLFEKARKRLGMPELQVPMTDLQYASMIYGKGCNLCGKKNAGKLDTVLRMRICAVCWKNKFTWELHLSLQQRQQMQGKQQYNRYTHCCADRSYGKLGNSSLYLDAQLETISKELDEKFPHSTFTREWGTIPVSAESFPRADGLKVEEVESANRDWDYAMSMTRDIAPPPRDPEPGLQTWIKEKSQYRKLKRADAVMLDHWLDGVKLEKSQKTASAREKRREMIMERLEAAGFHESEFKNPTFSQHPQVDSNKPLTDRHYFKTVEPALRQVLEENRREQNREALEGHYTTLRRNLRGGDTLPPASIYLGLAVLQPIINDVSINCTDYSLAPPEDIQAVAMEEMSRLARDRMERCLRALVVAHADLAKEEEERKQRRFGTSTEEKTSPTTFTRIEDLPLTLHPLPSWIPRDEFQPILASDEQIYTFLETSPLAYFECTRCHELREGNSFFRHFDSRGKCIYAHTSQEVVEEEKDWMGINVVGGPLRIDKDVLSLTLKLAHLVDITPLEIDDKNKVPDLGPDYQIALPEENWYDVKIKSQAFSRHRDFDIGNQVTLMYNYLRRVYCGGTALRQAQVKTEVEYSRPYKAEYRSLRRIRAIETGDGSKIGGFESDDPVERYPCGDYQGDYGWDSDSGISVGSRDEGGECVIM